MKLKKLLLKKISYMGVQCPYHHPAYITKEHAECLARWNKETLKIYKESFEYKQTEIINHLIEYLNKNKRR